MGFRKLPIIDGLNGFLNLSIDWLIMGAGLWLLSKVDSSIWLGSFAFISRNWYRDFYVFELESSCSVRFQEF